MAASLVCLHGLAGSARWWARVTAQLEDADTVDVLDLPRRLSADRLTGWVADHIAADRQPVDLAGHSLGALVGVRVAASHPELVRRLILIAPPGLQPPRSPLHLGFPLLVSLTQLRPRFMPTLLFDALRAGPRNIVRGGLHVATADVSVEARCVRAPTLLIWGARDRLVPLATAAMWQHVIPDARLVVLARSGHVPMVDAPGDLAAAITVFREEPLDQLRDEKRL